MIRDGRLTAVQVGNRPQPTVASIERLLGKPIEQLEAALHNPQIERTSPHVDTTPSVNPFDRAGGCSLPGRRPLTATTTNVTT